MRSRSGFDEVRIARFRKEGRGLGHGDKYKPWLTIRDVPSQGRSHRLLGVVTGRIHHLLSDIELGAFLIYDFRDDMQDIREQFPLDVEVTRRISQEIGIRHPVDVRSRTELVQTTDFLLDLQRGDRIVTLARTVKPSEALNDPRTVEKLEIERRYWTSRGVDWGIVTERDLPPILLSNLKFLQGCASLEDLEQSYPGLYQERATLVDGALAQHPDLNLQEFSRRIDNLLSMKPGEALLLVKHLLAIKVWRTDMEQPITETTVMSAFWREPASAARRVQ
ncbi:heteromeric transposase endonuclease subunit TnsA [Neomegalonema perideroedes]|uniref:heteromeric transposase endonuclease subunit TnsA n=1 Tax=Neomegalonema perideroedes TaxID=217219 RepID=UPI000363E9B1|nr:heteromeric transposase endonuclease subunit TnsA [Neomegalonema perideroedes]